MSGEPDQPTIRRERHEMVRRLQVGLGGLVVVLLMVALADLLSDPARQDAEIAKAQAEAAGVANPGAEAGPQEGPLADLGVEPTEGDAATVPAANLPAAPAPAGPATAQREPAPATVVPDLQPDPQIRNPARR